MSDTYSYELYMALKNVKCDKYISCTGKVCLRWEDCEHVVGAKIDMDKIELKYRIKHL